MKKLPGKPEEGFTLLEVLVALSMISIVFVGVLRLQGQSITMNETARFYSVAPFLAQAKMTEIRHNPTLLSGANSGDFGNDFPGYDWEAVIEEIELEMEDDQIPVQSAEVRIAFRSAGLKFVLSGYIYETDGEI